MRIGLLGASGRMGRSVARVAVEMSIPVVAAVDQNEVGRDVGDVAGCSIMDVLISNRLEALQAADVIIDFSLPGVICDFFERAMEWGIPVVTGTTGLDEKCIAIRQRFAKHVAVVAAPNFSQGVAILFHLAKVATAHLGAAFDAEIAEVHHRHKVDAPSGTAMRLAEIVAQARGGGSLLSGREGHVGKRETEEIGVFALRGGDVVGEHTLHLLGVGEQLALTHRATDRLIFARGALRSAIWVHSQPPGLYSLADVMGLR